MGESRGTDSIMCERHSQWPSLITSGYGVTSNKTRLNIYKKKKKENPTLIN